MKKDLTERLLSPKLRTAWIIAPQRSTVFNPELEELENVFKMLSRDKAIDLAEFTVKHFKLPHHISKVFPPPSTSQKMAAEILCDELKIYLNRYRSITIFRKMVVFKNHYTSLISYQ